MESIFRIGNLAGTGVDNRSTEELLGRRNEFDRDGRLGSRRIEMT